MDIKSIYCDAFNNIDTVCIAIARPDRKKKQQHIGLLYFDGEKVKFLHLAWHCDLLKETPDEKYLWLDIPLDPINKMHLATVCELIYETNKEAGIPYGLSINGTGFAKDGRYTADEHYAGLTCATFVIQVLRSQGLQIIDFDKWQHRQADKRWQMQTVQKLERRASREHIQYQRKKIQEGAARFKPEEVAVAASLPNPPYGAEAIKEPTSILLKAVIEHINKIAKK